MNIEETLEKKWKYILLAILVTGLILRFFVLYQTSRTVFYLPLTLDPAAYEKTATELLTYPLLIPKTIFYQAPLYPYLLALGHIFTGNNLLFVRLLQILMGVFIPLLVYYISVHFFSKIISLISAFIACYYTPLFFEESLGDKTILAVFLFTVATLVTISSYKKNNLWFLAGLFWGISSLVRENSLLVVVVIAILLAKKNFWKVILGVVIVITPITLSNLMNGEFVLITSQGGQNFYIGNNSKATGSYTTLPFVRPTPEHERTDFKNEAEARVGKDLTASEVSFYWLKQGISFLSSNPEKAVPLYLTKMLLLVNSYEIPDNYNLYFLKKFIPLLRLPLFYFGIIGPLAIIGLLISLWSNIDRKIVVLHLIIIIYSLSLVLFFIVGRYRILIVPLLIPFAVYSFTYTTALIKKCKWKKLVILIPAICLSVILVNHRQSQYPISSNFVKEYYMLANSYQKINNLSKAINYWELALKENPTYTPAKHNIILARLLLRADSLKQQLAIDSLDPYLLVEYGTVLFDMDSASSALLILDKALTTDSTYAKAWAKKALIYSFKMNNFEKAKIALTKATFYDSINAYYWTNLGNCYFELGDRENTLKCWKKSHFLNPKDAILKKNISKLEAICK
jgi:hypothetical protein